MRSCGNRQFCGADIAANRGSEIIANSPEECSARLKRDIPRYRKIMAEAGIQPQ